MTRHKSEDSHRFAVMLGSNLKFLRLNRKIFMPQKFQQLMLELHINR